GCPAIHRAWRLITRGGVPGDDPYLVPEPRVQYPAGLVPVSRIYRGPVLHLLRWTGYIDAHGKQLPLPVPEKQGIYIVIFPAFHPAERRHMGASVHRGRTIGIHAAPVMANGGLTQAPGHASPFPAFPGP